MPQAGWCAECDGYAWVCSDGGCDFGHPRSSLRGLYETQPDSSSGRPLPPSAAPAIRESPSLQHSGLPSLEADYARGQAGQAACVSALEPDDGVGLKLRMRLDFAAAWCGVIGGLTAINSLGSHAPVFIGMLSPRLLIQVPATDAAASQASGLFIGLIAGVVFFALSYFVRIGRLGALWTAAAIYGVDLMIVLRLVGSGDILGLALRAFALFALVMSGIAVRRFAPHGGVDRLAAPDRRFGTLTPGRFGRAVLIGVGVVVVFVAVLVTAIKLFAR